MVHYVLLGHSHYVLIDCKRQTNRETDRQTDKQTDRQTSAHSTDDENGISTTGSASLSVAQRCNSWRLDVVGVDLN